MNTKIIAYHKFHGNANQKQYQQISLPAHTSQKPQIVNVSEVSHKQRDRYRVVIGEEILGDRLTLDQAIELAKRGVQS